MMLSSPPAPLTQTTLFADDAVRALRINAGDGTGQSFVLAAGTTSIGSGERCNLRLQAAGIEPVQCMVFHGGRQTVVRRLAEAARLNGRPFSESLLQPGDQLSFGPIELQAVSEISISPSGRQQGPRAGNSERGGQARLTKLSTEMKMVRTSLARVENRQTQQGNSLQDVLADLANREVQYNRLSRAAKRLRRRERELDDLAAAVKSHWAQRARGIARRESELSEAEARLSITLDQAGLDARWQGLEQQLTEIRSEQAALGAERGEWRESNRRTLEQLQARAEQIDRRLESLALQQKAADRQNANHAGAEAKLSGQQGHFEQRLSELRAEREAFEEEKRQEHDERALSRLVESCKASQRPADRRPPVGAYESEPISNSLAPIADVALSCTNDASDADCAQHPADAQLVEDADPMAAAIETSDPESSHESVADEVDAVSLESSFVQQAEWTPSSEPDDRADETEAQSVDPSYVIVDEAVEETLADLGGNDTDIYAQPEDADLMPDSEPELVEPIRRADVLGETDAQLVDRHDEHAEETSSTEIERLVELATRAATTSDSPVQQPALPHADPTKEESIEDYMARLMERVRGITTSSPSTAAKASQPSVPQPSPVRVPQVALPPEPALVKQEPAAPETGFMRKASPPERSPDLGAMRELANMNARSAIDTHARNRAASQRRGKLVVIALAVAAGILVLLASTSGASRAAAGVCAIVALMWGWQYLVLTRRVGNTDSHSIAKKTPNSTLENA